MTGRVAVVGGGLAGITAATRCADAGRDVLLLESRPRLGGLTHSFRRGDLQVDNGQHVFLRCCTSYLALLDRLGVRELVHLQPQLEIPVRAPGHTRTGWLRRTRIERVSAPYHLAGAVLRYPWLSARERWSFARAALKLREVDPADPTTDETSFAEWLLAHGQTPRSVAALWDLVGVATLNAPAQEASLALAATVFQVGLLTDPSAADVGWSRVPLGMLHGEAARQALEEAGARVRLHTPVRSVQQDGARWLVTTEDGCEVVDGVVVAVPPATAEALLPAGAALGRSPRAGADSGGLPLAPGWATALGASPIVNVHVRYDRAVLDQPFVAVAGSPLQWVFDRSEPSGLEAGQYLAASISAAAGLVARPTADIRALVLPALEALLPATQQARLLDFFVTRERAATFSQGPGTASLRPLARTAAPGLVLAGAWTDTGWPATMEGAVRSGENAAAALLDVPTTRDPAVTVQEAMA